MHTYIKLQYLNVKCTCVAVFILILKIRMVKLIVFFVLLL